MRDDADGRAELIQYVYARYGPQHAAMACTVRTFGERSALRDLARVGGVALTRLLRDDKTTPTTTEDLLVAALRPLAAQLAGHPRHLGQHNGGMVLTAAPLIQRLPTEPAAMPGRTVVQWDKDALETAGEVRLPKVGSLGKKSANCTSNASSTCGSATTASVMTSPPNYQPGLDHTSRRDCPQICKTSVIYTR